MTRHEVLADAVAGGRRMPGMDAGSLLGWVAVGIYLLGAVLCARAAWIEQNRRERPVGATPRSTGPAFWWALTLVLLLLGVDRQINFLVALTDMGRNFAMSQRWYATRQSIQVAFISAIALAGVVGLLAFSWFFRRARVRYHAAISGLIFLLTFVTIRAASLHSIDAFISRRMLGLKWNWFLELGGIGLIAAAAICHLRTSPRMPQPDLPEDHQGPRTYRIPRH